MRQDAKCVLVGSEGLELDKVSTQGTQSLILRIFSILEVQHMAGSFIQGDQRLHPLAP